jgi:hypothetical protein
MTLSPAGTINHVISLNGLGASAGRSANQSQGTGQGADAFIGAMVDNAQTQNAALFQMPTAGSSVGPTMPVTFTIPDLQIPGIATSATQVTLIPTVPTFAAIPPSSGPRFFTPTGPGLVLPQPDLLNTTQQLVASQTSLLTVPTFEPASLEEEEEEAPPPRFNLPGLSNAATERSLALPNLPSLRAITLNPATTISIADIPVIGLPTPLLDTNTEAANLDTNTEAANLDTNTEAANLDTDTEAANLDTNTEAANLVDDATEAEDTDAASLDTNTDAANLVDNATETEETEEASAEEAAAENARPDPFGLNNAAANFAILPIRFLDNRVLSPTDNGGDASNSGSQTATSVENTLVGNNINVTV